MAQMSCCSRSEVQLRHRLINHSLHAIVMWKQRSVQLHTATARCEVALSVGAHQRIRFLLAVQATRDNLDARAQRKDDDNTKASTHVHTIVSIDNEVCYDQLV